MNKARNELSVRSSSRKGSSNMNIRGNLDGIFGNIFAGWFFCESDNNSSQLSLYADGSELTVIDVKDSRPDVVKNLGYAENSGFKFDLTSLGLTGVVELTVKHKETGFDFFSKSIMFSPEVAEFSDQLSDLVFPEYYRSRYELADLSNNEAVHHYLSVGVYSDYNPSPWFDNEYYRDKYLDDADSNYLPVIDFLKCELKRGELKNDNNQDEKLTGNQKSKAIQGLLRSTSELFDAAFYLEKNRDLESNIYLLSHYTNHGRFEGRECIHQKVPLHIQNELQEYLDIEPALLSISNNIEQIVRYPFLTGSTYIPNISRLLFDDKIQVVICVPFVTVGGADLLATLLIKAYEQEYGEGSVLLMVTSSNQIEVESWIGADTNVLLLDNQCKFIDRDDKIHTLHRVIATLAPEKVINVNSSECWELFEKFGNQLSSALNLYAYIFCFDYDKDGRKAGYIPQYIPETLDVLTKVFCDNSSIIEELKKVYGFSASDMEKFCTLYSPVPESLPIRCVDDTVENPKILWAGRLAHQKRPDILVKIACALPNESFVVYGPPGNSPVSADIISGKFKNIEYAGVYSDISEVPLDDYYLYLNTSQWDGIPTMLLTLIAAGLPVVSSTVGGISEVIDESTGWVVDKADSVQEYVTSMRKAMVNRDETNQRAEMGASNVRKIHSWENYISRLTESGAFLTRNEYLELESSANNLSNGSTEDIRHNESIKNQCSNEAVSSQDNEGLNQESVTSDEIATDFSGSDHNDQSDSYSRDIDTESKVVNLK